MTFYALDVIKIAYNRTLTLLFKPLNITKLIDYCVLWFFLVSGSMSFYQSPKSISNFFGTLSNLPRDLGHPRTPANNSIITLIEIFRDLRMIFSSRVYPDYLMSAPILTTLLVLLIVVIIMLYISSTIEFVLVNSLVHNCTNPYMSFKRFRSKGFQLFCIKIAVCFVSVSMLILLLLSQYRLLPGPELYLSITTKTLVLLVALLFFIFSEILGFFIGLSIPIALYSNISVLSALLNVFKKCKHDFKQLFVYCIARVTINLFLGIFFIITLVPLISIPGIVIVIMEKLLEAIIQPETNWFIIAGYRLFEYTILIIFILLASLPVNIYLKYHMYSFLEKWYPDVHIPFSKELS